MIPPREVAILWRSARRKGSRAEMHVCRHSSVTPQDRQGFMLWLPDPKGTLSEDEIYRAITYFALDLVEFKGVNIRQMRDQLDDMILGYRSWIRTRR